MSSIWHAALCCHWHPVKSVHTTLSRCRVMASDVILEMSPSSRRVRPRCMQGRGRYGGLGGMCRLTACFPCHGYHTSSHGCQWEQWKPLGSATAQDTSVCVLSAWHAHAAPHVRCVVWVHPAFLGISASPYAILDPSSLPSHLVGAIGALAQSFRDRTEPMSATAPTCHAFGPC